MEFVSPTMSHNPGFSTADCVSSVLAERSVYEKLKLVEAEVHKSLLTSINNSANKIRVPQVLGRDISTNAAPVFSGKTGLQSKEGQARLLHDLANIELQAVELGLRTLHEFSDTPIEFREELARITLEEASHLQLCLSGLEDLGHKWGDWSIQTTLWDATSESDSLIDRILIVHCYLEGSGLDAGDILLNRLGGVANKKIGAIVNTIVHDEVGHVDFGRRWFQHFSTLAGFDPKKHLRLRLAELVEQLPARGAKISRPLREKSGYDDEEICTFEEFQVLKVEMTRNMATKKTPNIR